MSIYADQLQPFSLNGSGAVAGATSVTLKSMLTIDGDLVIMSDFGDIGYGTIEPGSNSFEEQISFTGITQNSNGTATLTGVKSVEFAQPFLETSGLSKTHAGSTVFVISNTSSFTSSYANKNNAEIITANWQVPDPVGSLDIANKEYVLSVVNGGSVSFDQEIVAGTSGEALTSGNIVYLKNDGKWWKASASAAGTCLNVQLGVAQASVLVNVAVNVLVTGMDKKQSGMVTGTTYYLQNIGGTIGTSAGTISVDVGEAISASNLLFQPLAATTKVLSSVANVRTSTTGVTSQVPMAPSSGAPNLDVTWINATTGTTDQSQATQNSTITVGEQNLTTKHYLVAQKFVPARQSISGVRLYKAADSGSFTGTVKIALQADTAGSPSGADLASYTISNVVWLKQATGTITVAFSSEYETLTVGGSYWIVVTPSTTDNTNHPNLGINTAGGYASGLLKYNNTTDGWVTVATSMLTFATIDGLLGKIPVTSSATGMLPSLVSRYSLLGLYTTANAATNTVTETVMSTIAVPAGTLNTANGLHVRTTFTCAVSGSGGGTALIKVKYNGTAIMSMTGQTMSSSNNQVATSVQNVEFFVMNNASLSSQTGLGTIQSFTDVISGTPAAGTDTFSNSFNTTILSSVDTSAPGVLEITATNSSSTASFSTTHNYTVFELIA